MKTRGYFTFKDSRIDTIKYANWGSRPYEYKWVMDMYDVLCADGMNVIDLGVGEPEYHGWPNAFRNHAQPSLYVGIDCCPAMAEQGVDTDSFKLQQMDMTNLQYPLYSFDAGICISTFEHLESLDMLMDALREAHRVLSPGAYFFVTMDEIWDGTVEQREDTYWSFLHSALVKQNYLFVDGVSFSMNDLVKLAAPYFAPLSRKGVSKENADTSILHNEYYNNAISYCVFRRL